MKSMYLAAVLSFLTITTTSAQWIDLRTETQNVITGVHFVSPDTAFIVAGNEIMRTMDDAKTWQTVFTSQYPNELLSDITFASRMIGFALGKAVYRTIDGGNTWEIMQPLTINGNEAHTWKISVALDTQFIGTAAGYNPPQSSTDTGRTWKTIHDPGSTLNPGIADCIHMVDSRIGYLGGENYPSGVVTKTTDGGRSWRITGRSGDLFYFELMDIRDCHFIDSNVGLVVGNRPTISQLPFSGIKVMRTTDGGVTWDSAQTQFDYIVRCVTMSKNGIGFVSDEPGYVYYTSDTGRTWKQELAITRGNRVYDICMLGDTVAYLVGESGMMMKRTLATKVFDDEAFRSNDKNMEVYPNPTRGRFTVVVRDSDRDDGFNLLTISNELGQVLFSQQSNTDSFNVDLGNFSSGLYYIRVCSGKETHTGSVLFVE